MFAWIILLALLLVLLILPVGVDAALAQSQFSLHCKIGCLCFRFFPGKHRGKTRSAPRAEKRKRTGPKLKRDDIFMLFDIALRALQRVRAHLSIDLLRLHWTAGAEDPYDAVIQYGAVNAALNILYPVAHGVLHIREEDFYTDLSYELEKPEIDLRVVATLQLWEIMLIGICSGAALLRWYWRKRKGAGSVQRLMAQKGTQ